MFVIITTETTRRHHKRLSKEIAHYNKIKIGCGILSNFFLCCVLKRYKKIVQIYLPGRTRSIS